MDSRYEIVIIGAGPCGVTAGNLLGSYGIRTLIVDKEADVIQIPRAIGMCNEGARILNAMGLYDVLLNNMRFIDKVKFTRNSGRCIFFTDMQATQNGYREQHMFYQPKLESDMREGLKRYDCVDLVTETECLQIEQSAGEARLWLRDASGQRCHVSCQYVMAADGARSAARKMAGIGFEGKTYAQDWLILDVSKDPCPGTDIEFFCNPERPGVTLPAPLGKRRWEFVVKQGEDHETMLREDTMRELLRPWGDAEEMRVERSAIYTFHARVAENFRNQRVFLLGDAAHITPPFAGQGMMAGLRDAYNLSWKLAAVLRGRLDGQILDSYDRERRPQVRQIINFARLVGSVILPQHQITATLRDAAFRLLRSVNVISETKGLELKKLPNHINGGLLTHFATRKFRQMGIELPQYPISDSSGQAVSMDDRMAGQFKLLALDCDALDFLDDSTRQRWQQLGGGSIAIGSGGRGALLNDSSGQYEALFARGKVVIVCRPDKMMVLRCRPAELDRKLNAYLNRIGCPRSDHQRFVQGAY